MRAKCIRTCVTPVHGIVTKGEIKNLDDHDVPWAKHFRFLDPMPEAMAMNIKLPKAKPAKGGDAGTPSGQTDNAAGSGAVFPKHLGGGTFQLSNGGKVKGKDAAEAAEAALKQ